MNLCYYAKISSRCSTSLMILVPAMVEDDFMADQLSHVEFDDGCWHGGDIDNSVLNVNCWRGYWYGCPMDMVKWAFCGVWMAGLGDWRECLQKGYWDFQLGWTWTITCAKRVLPNVLNLALGWQYLLEKTLTLKFFLNLGFLFLTHVNVWQCCPMIKIVSLWSGCPCAVILIIFGGLD